VPGKHREPDKPIAQSSNTVTERVLFLLEADALQSRRLAALTSLTNRLAVLLPLLRPMPAKT
jgi:hypothetical protein